MLTSRARRSWRTREGRHLCASTASAVAEGDECVTSLRWRLREGVALGDLDIDSARWVGDREHDRVAVAGERTGRANGESRSRRANRVTAEKDH